MPWLWGPQTPAKPNISWASFRAFFEASLNYMVFVRNKTYDGFADHDSRIFVINCPQKEAELWLKLTNKQADCFGRLRLLERRERPHGSAGFSRLFSLPRSHQLLGFDTADHQHCKTIPEKTWPPSFCSTLHRENHESHLWRLRRRAVP